MAPESIWLFAGLAALATALLTIVWWEQYRRRRSSPSQPFSATAAARQARALEAWKGYFFHTQDREQRRITGELHDGVVQHLAGITMLVHGLETRLRQSGGEPTLAEDAHRIGALLQETSERALARLLAAPGSPASAPMDHNPRDVAQELQELAQSTEARFMIPCTYSGPSSMTLPGDTSEQLRAIAEIALTTALHDAAPGPLSLHLQPGDLAQDLLMMVESEDWDIDGEGGGSRNPLSRSQRLMSLRTSRLGGTLTYSKREPRGTRLECRIPSVVESS